MPTKAFGSVALCCIALLVVANCDLIDGSGELQRNERLLQTSGNACNSSCSVNYDGEALQYCFCNTLIPAFSHEVHYSQVENGKMEVVLSCDISTVQWCAIGFPAPSSPGIMLNGNAIVLMADVADQGTRIMQYSLGGYDTASVKVGENLKISDINVFQTDTQLVGTFTITANAAAPLTGSTQNVIYSAGRQTSAGALRQHTQFGYAIKLRLASGIAAAISSITSYIAYRLSSVFSPVFCKSYKGLAERDRKDWDSRWSSTYHAYVITALAAYIILFTDQFREPAPPGQVAISINRSSWWSNAALGFSLGYFALDLALLLAYFPWMGGVEMVAHHTAAFVSVLRAVSIQQAHLYTIAMLATEVTTPFINLRWLMDKAGMRSHPVYIYNGLAIALFWSLFRIVLFVPFGMHLWQHREQLLLLSKPDRVIIAAVPVLLVILNLFWYYKILKGGLKLLLSSGKSKKEVHVQ